MLEAASPGWPDHETHTEQRVLASPILPPWVHQGLLAQVAAVAADAATVAAVVDLLVACCYCLLLHLLHLLHLQHLQHPQHLGTHHLPMSPSWPSRASPLHTSEQ